MKRCYICEKEVTQEEIATEEEMAQISEEATDQYLVHCRGPDEYFEDETGFVIVCKACAKRLRR